MSILEFMTESPILTAFIAYMFFQCVYACVHKVKGSDKPTPPNKDEL